LDLLGLALALVAFGATSSRLETASINSVRSLSACALRSAVGMYFAWFTALRQSLRLMSCDMMYGLILSDVAEMMPTKVRITFASFDITFEINL